MQARSYGGEIAINWQVTKSWQLKGSYSYLDIHSRLKMPTTLRDQAENSPRHQANLQSFLTLPYAIEFDNLLYYISQLSDGNAPAYLRLDSRLGWWARKNIELSVGVRNLLDKRHPEFIRDVEVQTDEVPRTIYLQGRYYF